MIEELRSTPCYFKCSQAYKHPCKMNLHLRSWPELSEGELALVSPKEGAARTTRTTARPPSSSFSFSSFKESKSS